MPNWCVNHMKITGAAGEITRFKQTCIIDGKLDFNTIIPKPLAWALFRRHRRAANRSDDEQSMVGALSPVRSAVEGGDWLRSS